MKKVCQDYHSFEYHPFYLFGPFGAVFDIPEGSFEILIVSDWFHQVHKVPWHVMNPEHIESLPKPWKKCVKTAVSFENLPFHFFGPFLAAFDFDYGIC